MLETLVDIHNILSEISVKGEDTIRMSRCLVTLRTLVSDLQKMQEEEQHNGIQQTISTDNREQDTSVLPGQN